MASRRPETKRKITTKRKTQPGRSVKASRPVRRCQRIVAPLAETPRLSDRTIAHEPQLPLFAGDGYAGVSQLALWYIGGLIKHGPALSAIIAPTTNSYKRLVPGFEAPVNLAYSRRNRSAAVRIPMYSVSPEAKRVEFRPPDPSCNPYMAFAAMLMAGLDGIEQKMDPGQPMDKDTYDLGPDELASLPSMPGSLEDALDALQRDYAFLLKGDVFTEELLRTYVEYKRSKEVDAIRQRPHPYEFALYYDI